MFSRRLKTVPPASGRCGQGCRSDHDRYHLPCDLRCLAALSKQARQAIPGRSDSHQQWLDRCNHPRSGEGRINLGFIRPVENIGSLRWQSIANERYLLAVPLGSPLEMAETVTMSDLKRARIIAFSRSNLSYTEKYFFEQFRKHGLLDQVAYSCDDTLSLVSLVAAGIGVGFLPEWTKDLPHRSFRLREVEGVDFTIGMGLAWNKEDPTANREEFVEIARSLASVSRPRKPAGGHSERPGKSARVGTWRVANRSRVVAG